MINGILEGKISLGVGPVVILIALVSGVFHALRYSSKAIESKISPILQQNGILGKNYTKIVAEKGLTAFFSANKTTLKVELAVKKSEGVLLKIQAILISFVAFATIALFCILCMILNGADGSACDFSRWLFLSAVVIIFSIGIVALGLFFFFWWKATCFQKTLESFVKEAQNAQTDAITDAQAPQSPTPQMK